MCEDGNTLQPDSVQRIRDDVSLCISGPNAISRPGTMAKPRTVERDNTVFFRCSTQQPAYPQFFRHTAVTVQEEERFAAPVLQIVQPHTVDVEKSAFGGMPLLRFARENGVADREDCAHCDSCNRGAERPRTLRPIFSQARVPTFLKLGGHSNCTQNYAAPTNRRRNGSLLMPRVLCVTLPVKARRLGNCRRKKRPRHLRTE